MSDTVNSEERARAVPVFDERARMLVSEGEAPVFSAPDSEGVSRVPGSAPGTEPELWRLACRIFTEYRRRFANVRFEPFKKEWLAAAAVVAELKVSASVFVEAQGERRIPVDPEDLATPQAVDTCRRYVAERDSEIFDRFNHCLEGYFGRAGVTDLGDVPKTIVFPHSYGAFCPAFAVFAAIKCEALDAAVVEETLRDCCGRALSEFECSPSLRRHLKVRWGVDVAGVIDRLIAVAVQKELDESLAKKGEADHDRAPYTEGR